MNGREYFHESVVRDVVDILTSLKDYDEVQFLQNANNKRSFKSITSATKDLILTFPVLVSSDLDPDSACMVAKAHEKKCASLMHMLFTAISVESTEDVYDYVRKFHTNLGSMNGTLDSYADAFDRIASAIDENYAVYNIDMDVLNTVLEELKESNYILPDNIKESSIESFKIIPAASSPTMKDMIINEVDFKKLGYPEWLDAQKAIANVHVSKQFEYEAKADEYRAQAILQNTLNASQKQTIDAVKDEEYVKKMERLGKIGNGGGIIGSTLNGSNVSMGNTNNTYIGTSPGEIKNREKESMYKSFEIQNKAHNYRFLNAEYKKANELMPTMMIVNFISKGNETTPSIATTAIIGIKAKIYPVTSTDICNRVSSKVEDRNVLTNFVRATTNEIGFFRDFLFAIDKAKIDAKSYGRSASSNKLWKVLERRALKSKFRRSLKMYNDATAITLLTISSNDVDYMKKNYNIDITNVSTARKILDAYNFMGICILDEGIETASFLYDTGDDNYERLTFSNLEREASDSSYKKIVNLLTKMNR